MLHTAQHGSANCDLRSLGAGDRSTPAGDGAGDAAPLAAQFVARFSGDGASHRRQIWAWESYFSPNLANSPANKNTAGGREKEQADSNNQVNPTRSGEQGIDNEG